MLRSVVAIGLLASVPALVALSCTGDPPPTEGETVTYINQSIMGGVDDYGDPAVVGIVIMQGMGAGICSGTLIAPNLVLTARHCVASTDDAISCTTSTFGSTYSASQLSVTTEWNGPEYFFNTFQKTGNWYSANRIVVPPNSKVCGNDIALIQLKGSGVPSSVAQPIIPRVDYNVYKGEEYNAIGFGVTSDYANDSGRRRRLNDLFVSCVGSCFASVMDLEHEWEGDRGICQGDSGGPALDLDGRVIGVVSRGGYGCSMPIYGSVASWGDLIKKTALEAATAGGYTAAPWATGSPTGPEVDAGTGGTGGTGGSTGTGGTGGEGGGTAGTGGDPGLADLGQACQSPDDCLSGLCVYENESTLYCSQTCSDTAPCPTGFACNVDNGACFMTGGFGASCDEGCRSGMCVQDDNGTYCSQACTNDTECPAPATCDTEQGACFLPATPAGNPSTYNDSSGSSGGCSVAHRNDPTKPIPWAVGFGLALLGLSLRRK